MKSSGVYFLYNFTNEELVAISVCDGTCTGCEFQRRGLTAVAARRRLRGQAAAARGGTGPAGRSPKPGQRGRHRQSTSGPRSSAHRAPPPASPAGTKPRDAAGEGGPPRPRRPATPLTLYKDSSSTKSC